MIIVLSGADFSANNIGKIDLPVELDDTTKSILSMLTKYGATSMQAQHLNNFVLGLKSNGIYEKLTYLFLPIFAKELGEAFTNTIDGDNESPSDVTPYEIRQYGYGIKSSFEGKSTFESHFNLGKFFKNGQPADNFSMGIYRGQFTSSNRALFGSSGSPYFNAKTGLITLGLSTNKKEISCDYSSAYLESFDGVSYSGNDIIINFGGVVSGEKTISGSIGNATTAFIERFCFNGYSLTNNNPTGFFREDVMMMYVGTAMSQSQLNKLAELTTNLVAAIKA